MWAKLFNPRLPQSICTAIVPQQVTIPGKDSPFPRQSGSSCSKPAVKAVGIAHSTLLEQHRLCSYQRAMCKQYGATDAVASNVDVSKGREVLPKNVKPTNYRLTLEPNLETFEYDGHVEIEYVWALL